MKISALIIVLAAGGYFGYMVWSSFSKKSRSSRAQAEARSRFKDSGPSHDTSDQTVVPEEASHAQVLGFRGKVPNFAEIKRLYHERMLEYHPDKVAKLGPKLRQVAASETVKINAAYNYFRKKYNPDSDPPITNESYGNEM